MAFVVVAFVASKSPGKSTWDGKESTAPEEPSTTGEFDIDICAAVPESVVVAALASVVLPLT